MAYISLFRKYRPSNFDEVLGQDHIVRTLKNSLDEKKIAHAYLFCGPRGTGKTSTARIFAKALNCQSGPTSSVCNKCDMCVSINNGSAMDIIELDAASNTQVEKVREFIIQKVSFAPTAGRYKVYIIDEVHKLSDASFNALLKTLEEPPHHTVFILATTHPHELLPTIISRCQRFDFKRISQKEIIHQLRYIVQKEKLEIEEGALALIAQNADGSMRDSIVILEQLVSYAPGIIKPAHVHELLGLTDNEVLFNLSGILAQNNTDGALILLDELIGKGLDSEKLCQDLIEFYRRLLIAKVSSSNLLSDFGADYIERVEEHAGHYSAGAIINILKILIELKLKLKDISISRILWEMALVRITKWTSEPSLDKIAEKVAALEEQLKGANFQKIAPPESKTIKPVASDQGRGDPRFREGRSPAAVGAEYIQPDVGANTVRPQKEEPPVKTAKEKKEPPPQNHPAPEPGISQDEWREVLQAIKKEKVSLHAVLVDAKMENTPAGIKLYFKKGYDFHKDKALEHKAYLKQSIEKKLNKKIDMVEAAVSEEVQESAGDKEHENMVKDVMDVFG